MKKLLSSLALAAAVALNAGTAHAQTFTFSTSVGTQPTNVGVITLTQVNATTVNVLVDLLGGYGFLNTGGPHTPFAFNLNGTESGVSANFITPALGSYTFGVFSLSTTNGDNTPYGSYGISINNSAGNGSSNAYFGDLQFNVTRTSGLSTTDFITNGGGYYFSADLTDGRNTGAQAWSERSTTVPEPSTIALMSAGLAGMFTVARRRRTQA